MGKALLVDDSRAVRLACSRIIRSMGYEAIEAENGAVALDRIREHPDIDFVLLDWNMPVMDGLSFLKALRSQPMDKQPLVVMCSTENDMEHIATAVAEGANEYIMKPFTEEIIREKISGAGVQ